MIRFIENHRIFFGITAILLFAQGHWITSALNLTPFAFFTYQALRDYDQ